MASLSRRPLKNLPPLVPENLIQPLALARTQHGPNVLVAPPAGRFVPHDVFDLPDLPVAQVHVPKRACHRAVAPNFGSRAVRRRKDASGKEQGAHREFEGSWDIHDHAQRRRLARRVHVPAGPLGKVKLRLGASTLDFYAVPRLHRRGWISEMRVSTQVLIVARSLPAASTSLRVTAGPPGYLVIVAKPVVVAAAACTAAGGEPPARAS